MSSLVGRRVRRPLGSLLAVAVATAALVTLPSPAARALVPLPPTPLYLHSANRGYAADVADDPSAGTGLRAPRGSTADTIVPAATDNATGLYANGTVPGSPVTPTWSLPATMTGTVSGACIDVWVSKAGGTTPQQIDLQLTFKGPSTSIPFNMDPLSVYYTPGTVAHVVGYVSNATRGAYSMAKGSHVYLTSFIDGDQLVTFHYDSVTRPSNLRFNPDPGTCPTPPAPPPAPRRLVGIDAPTFTNYVPPAPLGRTAPRPSIGVDWSTDAVTVQGGIQTLRATGFDPAARTATWADVSPPLVSVAGSEALLTTSRATRRTFLSQRKAGCPQLATTDDSAHHWFEGPVGCGVGTGVEDQSIATGPYAGAPPAGARWPEAVWYCARTNVAQTCASSSDGGVTFGPGRVVDTSSDCSTQLGHGRPAVGPDGTIYVPAKNCSFRQAVAVSEDGGATWAVRRIPASSTDDESDPSVAVGSDGTVYAAFAHADSAGSKAIVAVSRDKGVTWTWLRDVGADFGIRNVQFPTVVAGDTDRVAVAFLGTPEPGDDQVAAFGAQWHVYVAMTLTGGHDWTTVDLTPDDPVQLGCVATAPSVTATCTNLGDLISAAVDRTGRLYVAYADGCTLTCVDGYTASNEKVLTVARQDGGVRLFETPRPSAPDVVPLTVTAGDGVVHLRWAAPRDNDRPITSYTVYRGLAPGAATELVTLNGAARSLDDQVTKGLTYYYSIVASNAIGTGERFTEYPVVAYVPGAVDPDRSDVTALPAAVPANGAATAAVTVRLADANGNPVSGKTVSLHQASGPGTPAISPSQATTDVDGEAVFGVRSTTAGRVEFRGTDVTDGIVVNRTAAVDFLPGPVDGSKSTLTASSGTGVADGAAAVTLTVVLRDLNGNPVPGRSVSVAPVSGPGSPNVSPAAVTTDASGRAVFQARTTTAGTVTFRATDVSDGVTVDQTASVSYQAGPASAAASGFVSDLGTVAANGTAAATLTVTLVDANGNPASGRVVTISTTAGSAPAISPASATTDATGRASFTARSTVAGPVTLRATDTTDAVVVDQAVQVTFTVGAASASASLLSAAPSSPVADGTAASTVTATVRDAYGNGISGKTVTLAVVSGPGTPTLAPASVVTDSAGRAAFTVRSTTAGSVTLRATDTTDGVVITQTATVTFVAGPASASASTVTASGAPASDGSATATVTVTLVDANGNAATGRTVSLAKIAGPGTPTIAPASAVTNSSGTAVFTVKSTTAGTVTLRATDSTDAVVVTQTADVTFVAPPGAPTGATAVPGNAQVTVSWTPASGGTAPTEFRVYRNGVVAATVAPGVTSATLTGLVNGTSYSFEVSAYSATYHESARTAPVSATPMAVPGTPGGFTATPRDAAVDLAWTAPTTGATPTEYRVHQNGTLVATLPGGTTSTSRTGLTNGQAYSFYVVAYATNFGASSPTSTLNATPVGAPAAPTGLAATAGDRQVRLDWSAATSAPANPVSGYRVYVDGALSTTVTAATTTHTVTGLTNFTLRSFTVASYNGTGEGTSAAVTATPTAPPTGVTASSIGTTSATLSWTAPTGSPTGYRIYVGGVFTASTASTSRVMTGLTGGTSYQMTVTAVNSATPVVESAASSPVTVLTRPATPTGLSATPGNAQLSATWTAPGGGAPTGYHLYLDGVLSATVAGTSATVTGLTNGRAYAVTVTAYNGTGDSAATGAVSATPMAAPGAPSGLTATPYDGRVDVAWSAPSGGTTPTEYRLYQNGVLVATLPAGTTTSSRTGLTNGQAYSYYVVAYATNFGTSAASNTANATPVGAPGAPASLAATAGDQQVALTWAAVTSTSANPVAGYRVYVDGALHTSVAAGTTSHTVTGLTNFTARTFAVRAYNGTGEAASPSAVATPTAPPANLAASGTGTSTVTLSWTAPSGSPTGYRVYANGSFWSSATGTSTSLTGLTGGTSYSFTVTAVNSANPVAESAASGAVSVLTKPATPTGLTVTGGNRSLSVSWTAPPGGAPAGYRVYTDGTQSADVAGTSAELTGLVNGQSYSITVIAYNATGDSATTAAVAGVPVLPAPAWYSLTDYTRTTGVSTIVTARFYTVTNATGYKLYRDGVFVSSSATSGPLAGLYNFKDSGRSFTTTHNYTVSAVDGTHEGPQSSVRTITTWPDDVPSSSLSVAYNCGSVANTYRLTFTWSAPVKGTWTGFRIYKADGTVSATVGSTIRTYTTGNQPEDPDGSGGFFYYSLFNTVNTGSTSQESDGYNPQGTSTKNC